MKSLEQVTDRFSLFNDGRKIGANKRKYIISAVKNMLSSERTKELIRLGEAYGYYGHQPRQRANKLSIGESEIININGRPVVVDNVPSNRTLKIQVSDDGVVEHTQEFLDTDTGKIALGLRNSNAGGWSWATGGQDTPQAAIVNSFHGMDYVLQPNFLSLDHPSMMMESAGRENAILESLQQVGFDTESSLNILKSMNDNSRSYESNHELETQVMYLEGLAAELKAQAGDKAKSSAFLLEAIDSLPIYVTDEQKAAISSLSNEHDYQVVKALFESLGTGKLATLPTSAYQPVNANKPISAGAAKLASKIVNLGSAKKRFS